MQVNSVVNEVIKVQGLMKKYGNNVAVYCISFNVSRGEIFALLGPNGAGKTTTVEVLELLKTPNAGLISILGNMIMTGHFEADRDYKGLKERIGVLPQSFNAFDLLTVYENMDYFASMYTAHANIDDLLSEFNLKDQQHVLFKNLSCGLKQRVGIAIALVNDPEIVFLDEPTTGLDPRARRYVWDAIKKLKARGKTVILTTHYMEEAHYLADRVCIIHKGQIIAEGTPEELINKHGGGNTLIIKECCTGARDLLLENIPGCATDGSNVSISLPDGDGTDMISKAISIVSSNRLYFKEIYVKKSTLEDVFLNLTGENLVDGRS